MDYINKNGFKNILSYMLMAGIIVLIFTSAVFVIKAIPVIAIIALIAWLGKKLIVSIKNFYYRFKTNNIRKSSPKWEIVKDKNYEEEFNLNKIIIDVEYEEVQ